MIWREKNQTILVNRNPSRILSLLKKAIASFIDRRILSMI
jgi:hypothetical protein